MSTSPVLAEFGKRICTERTKIKMSQKDLADLTNLTQHAISEIEHGKRDLRLTTVYRLAEGLNINPSYLVD